MHCCPTVAPSRGRALSQQSANAIPGDFKVSPEKDIIPGATVLHLKFGEGEIMSVEGSKENKVATIKFKNDDMAERRIVLKFAKLQVLS